MFENMLPIGTVVLLKDALKKLMIVGYKQMSLKDKGRIYDYVGVVYPAGSLGDEMRIPFDNENIQDIVFMGYRNSEFDNMIAALEKKAEEDPAFAKAISTKRVEE